ncbi:histidine kinase, partial [Nostoc sp. T09]
MEFANMLARLKLASQFTLLLSLIFITGIGLGGFALSKALEHKAVAEMNARGQMAMHIVNSVSTYTSDDIAPLITQLVDPQTTFIPETIRSIAARRVFENFKANWQYK